MANILKCNAEFERIYYVKFNNTLRECKFLGTRGFNHKCYYILNIAGVGVIEIEYHPQRGATPDWYRTSHTPSILYESIDAYRKGKPIIDNYGSTDNAYNSRFIEPFFPSYDVCGCGGGIYTWKWNGCNAVKYGVSVNLQWSIDENGFKSNLYNYEDYYSTKQKCEQANQIKVVRF